MLPAPIRRKILEGLRSLSSNQIEDILRVLDRLPIVDISVSLSRAVVGPKDEVVANILLHRKSKVRLIIRFFFFWASSFLWIVPFDGSILFLFL